MAVLFPHIICGLFGVTTKRETTVCVISLRWHIFYLGGNKKMKDESKSKEDIVLEDIEKEHDINERDIKTLQKLAWTISAVILVKSVILCIIYALALDVLNAVLSVIMAPVYVAIIAWFSRLVSSTAYTAKKNREILIKLTKALEEKDEESIKDIRQNIESEEVGEIIEPIKDRCPICFCELSEGTSICPNCGYDIDNPQENLRYMSNTAQENECPCCFAKISPDDIECPNCGYKLKEDKKQEE